VHVNSRHRIWLLPVVLRCGEPNTVSRYQCACNAPVHVHLFDTSRIRQPNGPQLRDGSLPSTGIRHFVGCSRDSPWFSSRFVGRRPDSHDWLPSLICGTAHLALAAIAAASALLAPMIRAGVLGAVAANVSRRLAADAAGEGDWYVHCFFPCVLGRLRQRCASLSTTANSCSFWLARSVMYWRNLSRLEEFSPKTPTRRSPTAGF
jgi:hypothetical protein